MEELRDLLLQVRNRLSSSSREDQFLKMILWAEESLRLLGTNDDPIKTKKLLQGPLNQCQALLCQKRQEMADLHCRRGALEEEERDLVNIAEKIKGLFPYIQRCPPEVICEIFLKCVDFYHSTDKPEDDFHDSMRARLIHPDNAPLLLLRICRKWRQIALNTPKLFTQLYLPHEMIEGEEMDSVLHRFLTCSGRLTLDVFLQAKTHHHFSFGRMDMVSAQISPCFSRICRITMPRGFLPHLFPPDSCTDAPALLDFRLYGDRMSASDRQFGRLVAPKLEVFSSPGYFNFSWEAFITFGECLKIFSGASNCYTLTKLHQLFHNSFNMEYCRVEYWNESPALQLKRDTPIFLPRLWKLSISTASHIWVPLLSQLMMPFLRKLCLHSLDDHGSSGESRLGGLITSFISARPSLEELCISRTRIEREEFHDLLRLLPELTTMKLEYCDIPGGLRPLVPAYAPDVCPKLATLDLRGSFWHPGHRQMEYEQDMIDIICSRACSRLSEDPEERTQKCLRYMGLLLGSAEGFSDVTLAKLWKVGDEYDINFGGGGRNF